MQPYILQAFRDATDLFAICSSKGTDHHPKKLSGSDDRTTSSGKTPHERQAQIASRKNGDAQTRQRLEWFSEGSKIKSCSLWPKSVQVAYQEYLKEIVASYQEK